MHLRLLTFASLLLLPGCSALWAATACNMPGCGPISDEMSRANVEGLAFASETSVTYRDGKTRLGVFFDEEHRQALKWDQLPPSWVVAIVASEDGNFWSHNGIDAKHIARAARDNLGAGGVVSGGSTLTQQTAKNLFEREGRSLGAKWEELDQAFQLEKQYHKREILTFYANEFHVTGNGRGLAIASRYFFDKDPQDLSLVECAYLAGLVKGPANYDPFQGDAERQKRATERALERTRYVLQRIVDEPIDHLIPKEGEGRDITQADVEAIRAEAQRLLGGTVALPFSKGQFRFDATAVLDEVNRRLQAPMFAQILGEAGITDPATAGLTIVTTLDAPTQHEATYGLWHHLTELGIMMEGRDASAFVVPNGVPPRPDPNHPPRRHEFRVAKVSRHVEGKSLEADLGSFTCALDRDAMVRAASAVYRGQQQDRSAKVPTAEIDAFVAGLTDDTVVWVSVRDVDDDGSAECDLEARPELQGAVVAVEDGELRAMVGGNTNKDFNRATAPRQMGSTFKTLVYHAAMTLGWQADDVLDNRENVFPFSGTYYFPSPDHEPSPWVSLAWAGVRSENLASVWLLYHLTDRLSDNELAELAQTVGLAKEPGEADDVYAARIQKAGVMPTKARMKESQFLAARREVLARLESEGQDEEARELRSLLFGWGYDTQRQKASKGQKWAYDYSYRKLESLLAQCEAQYEVLARSANRRDPPTERMDDLWALAEGRDLRVACGARPEGFDSPLIALRAPPEPAVVRTVPAPAPTFDARPAPPKGKGRKWTKDRPAPEPSFDAPEPELDDGRLRVAPKDEMIIDDHLTYGTLVAVKEAMERQAAVYDTAGGDLYSPDVLYHQQDFRVLLGMRYLTYLAARYGVQTDLLEVLSLPLGASEITLEEATRMYGGLVSGQTWAFEGTGPNGPVEPVTTPTMLISEIRDRTGNVLYSARGVASPVSTPGVAEMTADILRNVVLYGTGRSAKGAVVDEGSAVPIGGKTGTTNDFRNAAFIGYLPGQVSGGYSAAEGWTVGVYVGYDDNRSMKAGRISVAGAVGALPPWTWTVKGIAPFELFGPGSAVAGSDGQWPLVHSSDVVYRPVSAADGVPWAPNPGEVLEAAEVLTRAVRAQPEQRAMTKDASQPASRPPRGGKRRSWWPF